MDFSHDKIASQVKEVEYAQGIRKQYFIIKE